MNPTERITDALATVKSELVSLRSQDVKLMKQMISINDTIKRMSKRNRRSCPAQVEVDKSECTVGTKEAPLIRVQSIPDYCQMRRDSFCSTISSTEDVFSSSEDLSSCSEDGEGEDLTTSSTSCFLTVPNFNRRRSISPYAQRRNSATSNDCYYEDILKKNIKLWKHSKSISNESLNSVVSDESIPKVDVVES